MDCVLLAYDDYGGGVRLAVSSEFWSSAVRCTRSEGESCRRASSAVDCVLWQLMNQNEFFVG